MVGMNFFAEENPSSERGRAMLFGNADALGRRVAQFCRSGSEEHTYSRLV